MTATMRAAFITGLMRHCVGRRLPHPGVVLLDSPLLVYREPDIGPEDQRLRQAGVKDAFYRALAAGVAGGLGVALGAAAAGVFVRSSERLATRISSPGRVS